MIQCRDCEFCHIDAAGRMQFRCNPFDNVKEPECLQKWTLLKLDHLLQSYQSMLRFYQKFAPIQEKMMKYVEREIDEIDEADKWKYDDEDDRVDDENGETGGLL